MTTNDSSKKKSRIPYIFFAFFGVIFLVDLTYIYIAKKTWRGIFTRDSYQKGLDYNDTIKMSKDQDMLGWKVDMNYSEDSGERNGFVMISVRDKSLIQINDLKIQITFRRPTQEGFDFIETIDLVDGIYRKKISFPLKGQWSAELLIAKGDNIFYDKKRIVVK